MEPQFKTQCSVQKICLLFHPVSKQHFLSRDEHVASCYSLHHKKKNWVKYKEHFVNLEFKVLSLVLAKNVCLPSSFLCTILRKGLIRISRDLKNGWNENKIFVLSIFSHTSPGASAVSCRHKRETWVYINPLSSGYRTALIRAALATIYWSSATNVPRNIQK